MSGQTPSFHRYLRSLDDRFGSRVAITDYTHVRFSPTGEPDRPPALLSYHELIADVERHRQHLLARSIGAWDHVHLCLPNRLETLTLQYAAWSLGAIVSPINPEQRDRIGDILHSADALESRDSAPRRLVCIDGDVSSFASAYRLDPATLIHVDELAGAAPAANAALTPVFEDPVLILHTSGTTGKPKGCRSDLYLPTQ